jgi:hypothetical protein
MAQELRSMAKFRKYKWRIYADNNVSQDVVELLRQSGMNVLWVAEEPELRRHRDDKFHYGQAGKLGRYLLTSDRDFWDDRKFPLLQSPGLILLDSDDPQTAKYLPVILKKIIVEYNPTANPLYLGRTKTKLSSEGIVIKIIDPDTSKPSRDRWSWGDLV